MKKTFITILTMIISVFSVSCKNNSCSEEKVIDELLNIKFPSPKMILICGGNKENAKIFEYVYDDKQLLGLINNQKDIFKAYNPGEVNQDFELGRDDYLISVMSQYFNKELLKFDKNHIYLFSRQNENSSVIFLLDTLSSHLYCLIQY